MTTGDIAAFDLSLTGTGWATIADAKTYFGTLAPKAMSGMERLHWIMQRVCMNDALHPIYAKLVVMEDLAFAAHDRNHERAGLATLIRYQFWLYHIPYVLVAPTTLKKFVTGSGKAEKSQMMLEVYKRWHVNVKNDNEADAVGLLHIGMCLCGLESPKTKAQQEALKTVSKSNEAALAQVKTAA